MGEGLLCFWAGPTGTTSSTGCLSYLVAISKIPSTIPYSRGNYCHQRVSELGRNWGGEQNYKDLFVFCGDGIFCILEYINLLSGGSSVFSHRLTSQLVILCSPGNLVHAEFRSHWKVCFVLLMKPFLLKN